MNRYYRTEHFWSFLQSVWLNLQKVCLMMKVAQQNKTTLIKNLRFVLLIKLLNPSNLSTVMFYRSSDIHFIGLFCFSYFISTYILKCYSRQLSLTLGCFVFVNICCLLSIHASQLQSPITLKWLNLKLNNFDIILKFCHT